MSDNSLPTTSDAPSSSSSRGSRGRGAAQRNQDKFRLAKGREFNAANRRRIEEKCFYHLTEVTAELTKIEVKQVSVAQQLPMTTRALGYLCHEVFNKAQSKTPNPEINVYNLYRATLLQFELQVQQSGKFCKEEETFPRPAKQDCDAFVDYREAVLSRPKNFLPISTTINSFGHFSIFNSTYHPFVPLSYIRNHVFEATILTEPVLGIEGPKVEHIVTGSSIQDGIEVPTIEARPMVRYDPACRYDIKSGWLPDPYTTTISNLRKTVVALASHATPAWARNFYYYRNPIPGAEWALAQGSYILLNPDAIMPENYRLSYIKQDLDKLQNWLAKFKGKVAYADGCCDFTGKGTSSQIVKAKADFQLVNGELEYTEETYLTSDGITDAQFYLGILSLYGEYPDSYEPFENFKVQPPPLYGLRHHGSGSHLLPVSWDTVMQATLK